MSRVSYRAIENRSYGRWRTPRGVIAIPPPGKIRLVGWVQVWADLTTRGAFYPHLLEPLILVCLVCVLWPAAAAWTQEIQEMELERRRRDFEALVERRLASYEVEARRLREQAEQVIQVGSPRGDPQCKKTAAPLGFEALTAELTTALRSTGSRLDEEHQSYMARVREYEQRANERQTTDRDRWLAARYFALRLQANNLAQLQSRLRSLDAIIHSYQRALPETVAAVTTASCLARGHPPGSGDKFADSLLASLSDLISDYRKILDVALG